METVNFLKEWGAHLMSGLGIIGGLWAYIKHDQKLKSQERMINDMQIRQMQKSEDKERQAEIKANLISKGKGNYRIRFVNAGMSDALNVRVEILTPQENLSSVIFNGSWGPYNLINPQSYREEWIGLCMGHPDEILINVTWDDSFQAGRTSKLSVPL